MARILSAGVSRKFAVSRTALLSGIVLAVIAIAIFAPIMYQIMFYRPGAYSLHIQIAESMARTLRPYTPHPLYQLVVIAVHVLTPATDFMTSGFLANVLIYIILAEVLYSMLGRYLNGDTTLRAIAARIGLTLALMLVTPITLFAAIDRRFYLGYMAINVYHDPTTLIFKPTSILLFFYAVRLFIPNEKQPSAPTIVWSAALIVLATVAKPSFTICILPALGLWAIGAYLRKQWVNWRVLIGGMFVPAVLLLGAQYLFTYLRPVDSDEVPYSEGLALAPFRVYNYYSAADLHLPKFLLSILFPLLVSLLYYRAARKDISLGLAWVAFMIGCVYSYVFVEAGRHMMAGNFIWSGQITLFILFIVSAMFLLRQEARVFGGLSGARGSSRSFLICSTVFGLHLINGIYWYYKLLFEQYWFW